MIQRIQSLYLFVVFILMSLMFFMPLAQLIGEEGQVYKFMSRGIFPQSQGGDMILNAWPVALLLVVIALIAFITIFLYKKRMVQVRLTVFNILLMLGSLGLIYFNVSNQAEVMNTTVKYEIANIFPVIGAILSYLAIRSIGKDEALIKAMDRIR